ncbi:Uncharacterized protein Adt_31527 [Abeliophyllum distichum]|uniref:Uncharacterized protein n=1 Tax=Abeliophyllum distichum TaxID=126358 RepID=A0ABD1REB8_9LAMI
MKEVVYARHHLASVHSDYCRSFRITGYARVTFTSDELLAISDHTSAIFLRNSSSLLLNPHHIPFPLSLPPSIATTSTHRFHLQQPQRHKKSMKLLHILSEMRISVRGKTRAMILHLARICGA